MGPGGSGLTCRTAPVVHPRKRLSRSSALRRTLAGDGRYCSLQGESRDGVKRGHMAPGRLTSSRIKEIRQAIDNPRRTTLPAAGSYRAER